MHIGLLENWTFFPSTNVEWNKLDPNIRSSPSYKLFRKRVLDFIRPRPNIMLMFVGLTYLARLPVGLRHLPEHKLRHNFRDPLNPTYDGHNGTKSTTFSTVQISRMKSSSSCKMLESLVTHICYP